MKMTLRWFGEESDSVRLEHMRQVPSLSGIMGVLPQYAAGDAWEENAIGRYVDNVRAYGLEIEVIESVNIHEDIKLGLPSREEYIDNYIATVERLAANGVKVIIYNFMPVLDWLRTDLSYRIPADGSYCMYYDDAEVADVDLSTLVRGTIGQSNGFSLPGWEADRLSELNRTLDLYRDFSRDKLRENLRYFFSRVMPCCEKAGVKLAIHPDDPSWPVFGLPRIARSGDDLEKIVRLYDSPSNTICLCTGSLGSDPKNDIPAIIRRLGGMNAISCAHVRNLKFLGERKFHESAHPSASGDLDMFAIMKAIHEACPDVYIRPDHGRMIWGENSRPGYGFYDRALGAMYLTGLWEALEKTKRSKLEKKSHFGYCAEWGDML